MREEALRAIVSIGFLIQVAGFLGFGGLLVHHAMEVSRTQDMLIIEFGKDVKERDERMFRMNTRLQTLEEKRDMESRLKNLEKQLRVYCTGNKLEMCGLLDTINR